MASTQDLRRKIKSVKSTAKLTKAMQMVAASKMAKAVSRAAASRAYSDLAWQVVQNLVSRTNIDHPYLKANNSDRVALLVLTSNRGLAGSFNSQIIKKSVENLTKDTDLFVIGRRGQSYFRRFHPDKVKAEFDAPDSSPSITDIGPISSLVTKSFQLGDYGKIGVVYNRFISTLNQEPVIEWLLPIENNVSVEDEIVQTEYKIEPSPNEVINTILTKIVPSRIYQVLLDSSASEQSARMIAMKSATDNALEIADDLTLTYQSIRQANITREIIEVSSGAAALAN
ncbi:ATP synthase F1 subunit gamma [Candidatus Berkelbacteria bacterium]|nr:ATP synthase F1 subunit gamma [Candidatus Berkelbacteria bacterium]